VASLDRHSPSHENRVAENGGGTIAERAGKVDLDRWDYEQTVESIRQLTDIRFKLLAFVPTLSGAAIAIVTKRALPGVEAAIGAFGFFVTLGIAFYDQRNSALYDALISRARWLERERLRLPGRADAQFGGQFAERPPERRRLFGIVEVWHDRALALIYGTVLGGWVFPVLVGAGLRVRWAALGAVIVGVVLILELQRMGGEGPLSRRWWARRHRWRDRRRQEWAAEGENRAEIQRRIDENLPAKADGPSTR
jgi:hypothetical protein